MVRVGGLQILHNQKVKTKDPSGMTPLQQLVAVSERAHRLVEDAGNCFREVVEPALAEESIRRITPEALSPEQREYAQMIFDNNVFPVISPMAIYDTDHFPLVKNLSLNLFVRLSPASGKGLKRNANIPLGAALPRFIALPNPEGYSYLLLEDLVRVFIDRLFPGERILESILFRITRNADMAVREDRSPDLLEGMREILDARRSSDCVRLQIEDGATKTAEKFLKRAMSIHDRYIYRTSGPLQFSDFMEHATMDGFDHLRYEPWPPLHCPDIDSRNNIFDEIAEKDILLSHPYEQFEPVVRMIQEAAEDPNVVAIKQILYRTSKNSPIVNALQQAAQNGKYVTAIVELKARFDEAQNIKWARRLEEAGVQVIYGVKGFKTHAKLCIIVRKEDVGIVRYLHFGTGNYNEQTAKLYSDIGYLTCDEDLAADASTFFNAVTGFSDPPDYLKLAAAPMGLRERILELIEGETMRSRQGHKALIMAKMNSLLDPQIIQALYKASSAGVSVLLNVRGICTLRPGIKNLSENIRVVSIVDRFLEHSRIYYFRHGGNEQVLISSADMMPRNLDKRIELLIPVDDRYCRQKLVQILETYFEDNVKSSQLLPDGRYERLTGKKERVRAQCALYKQIMEVIEEKRRQHRTFFEPHKAPNTA